MQQANGYVLLLDPERSEVFEESLREYGSFAEPVSEFRYSRNVPLVSFVLSGREVITHVARARRGTRAGTGMHRLNLEDIQTLTSVVSVADVVELVPTEVL